MLSVAVLALMGQPLRAQETEGFFQMLGRVVFGAGVAKVAIDTPQAVTVLTQSDLDQKQPKNLAELLRGVPGVQTAGASSRALGQAFNIRGIGNTEQNASEERIKVSVDGAPKFFEQYRMGSFFGDPELFKRVEILRGPASSTLYGSGAIGGVLAFTTKDASDFLTDGSTTALRFKSSFASNGDDLATGVTYAQRLGDSEFLAAINHASGSTMRDGSGNPLLGTAHDTSSYLLKGKATFGDNHDQSLTFAASRSDTRLDDTLVAQTGGAAAAAFGTADVYSVDDTVTLTYQNAFADSAAWDVKVALSYTNTRVDKSNFSLAALCAPGTFQVLCNASYGYETTALTVENTSDLSVGAWKNSLIVGVQLSEQNRSATSSLGALAFHPEGVDDKLGLYAQGEFVWDDRLRITPGLRLDYAQRTPSAAARAAGGADAFETALSPKLAITYDLTPQFGLFGTVAATQRMPTLDELYSSSATQVASLHLENERAQTTELGLIYHASGLIGAGDNLQLKLTAFDNDLSNMIARNSGAAAGTPYYINIRNAQIWGAELEAAYDAPAWYANLAFSGVRSRDLSTGLTLADTPAQNVVLTLGWKLTALEMTLGWRASHFDGIRTSSAATSASRYDVHDLFATWTPTVGPLQGLEVNLAIDNVFDATYRNNLALDNAAGMNAKISVAKAVRW